MQIFHETGTRLLRWRSKVLPAAPDIIRRRDRPQMGPGGSAQNAPAGWEHPGNRLPARRAIRRAHAMRFKIGKLHGRFNIFQLELRWGDAKKPKPSDGDTNAERDGEGSPDIEVDL
jgi:hypothetical protein